MKIINLKAEMQIQSLTGVIMTEQKISENLILQLT